MKLAEFFYKKRCWVVALILSIGLMGGNLAYDAPGAIAIWLESDVNISPARLGFLYSAFSLPLIVFSLVCGVLADALGVRIFMVMTQALLISGCVMFASAYHLEEQTAYIIMLFSRAVQGIGLEGCAIISRKETYQWFSDRYRSIGLTIVVAAPLIGTQIGFLCLPLIATAIGGQAALWFVVGFCFVGAIIGCTYLIILAKWPPDILENATPKGDDDPLTLENLFPRYVSMLKTLPYQYWLVILVDMFIQGALWPFVAYSPDFFYHHYDYSKEYAGVFAFILAGAAFPTGLVISYFGFGPRSRHFIGIVAGILQVVCFLVIGWATSLNPIFATLGLSFVLSTVGTVIYAPFGDMVEDKNMGLLMGITKACENLSWTILAPCFGIIYEQSGNFAWSCTFYAGLGLLSIPLSVILFIRPAVRAPKEDKPLLADVE